MTTPMLLRNDGLPEIMGHYPGQFEVITPASPVRARLPAPGYSAESMHYYPAGGWRPSR